MYQQTISKTQPITSKPKTPIRPKPQNQKKSDQTKLLLRIRVKKEKEKTDPNQRRRQTRDNNRANSKNPKRDDPRVNRADNRIFEK